MLESSNQWLKIINLDLLKKTLLQIPCEGICPKQEDVFKAFNLCPLPSCKVVFLGQDPYPQKDVATGILFGNKIGTKVYSPSLQVIKNALETMPDYSGYFDCTLENWAKQGILMINSALTTQLGRIGSHTMIWRPFIADLIERMCQYDTGYIFVLFGKQAETFKPYINEKYNHIIIEKHPAYYARTENSMPCTIFQEINRLLKRQYNQTIVW